MNCDDVNEHIERFLEDDLDPATRRGVEAHLHECRVCRGVVEFRRTLQADTATTFLPRTPEFTPSPDPWPELLARPVRAHRGEPTTGAAVPPLPRPPMMRLWLPLAAAAAMALIAAIFWPRTEQAAAAWNVTAVAGRPSVEDDGIDRTGRLEVGQWLNTDDKSRARVAVGAIGELQVEPASRLKILSAATRDHRIELQRGTLFALVWAAPRLFAVETPAATVIDLGCAYTLSVSDAGTTTVHVTAGYVALERGERTCIVPAGMKCIARPNAGPGTPFASGAPAGLRDALMRYDFERGGDTALAEVLVYADHDDKVTLWHLLDRTSPLSRAAVYDRLAELQPPPSDVTREGILSGNIDMVRRWGFELGLAGK